MEKLKIFACYSRLDSSLVQPIVEQIEAWVKVPILTMETVLSKESSTTHVESAVESVDIVLLFYSLNASKSQWVNCAIQQATFDQKRVIPIRLDDSSTNFYMNYLSYSTIYDGRKKTDIDLIGDMLCDRPADANGPIAGSPRIFVSYKRKNSNIVYPIVEQIQSETHQKCWVDKNEIESDAQFVDVIIEAIKQADVFLFMYSYEHTLIEDMSSDWTGREFSFADNKKKHIIFLNLDRSPLTDWFIMMVSLRQQVDMQSNIEVLRLYDDLLKLLPDSSIIEKDTRRIGKSKHLSSPKKSLKEAIEEELLSLAWQDYNDGEYKSALRQFLTLAQSGCDAAKKAVAQYYMEGKACPLDIEKVNLWNHL